MVTGGRTLIAIGYKYNARKVLSFIVIDNVGITKECLPYLSNQPNQFSNVEILPVALPLVMYKLFVYVNEFDSHNKSRQSHLDLYKFWVNKFGCLRLCTKADMEMTIINLWKIFCYGVTRDHYEKSIGI